MGEGESWMQAVFPAAPRLPPPPFSSFVLTSDRKYEPKRKSQDAASTDGQTVSEGLGETGAKSIDSAAGVKSNNLVLHGKIFP